MSITKLLNCPTLYKMRAKYYKEGICACVFRCGLGPSGVRPSSLAKRAVLRTAGKLHVYKMYDVYLCVRVCRRKLL